METVEPPGINTLRQARLFEGLSHEQLEVIAPACRRIHCCRDRVFFYEENEAKEVYLVLEGEVCLEAELFMGYHLRPKTITINRVGKGDTFGWSALIEACHMTMTARCSKDTDMIVVSSDDLKALLNIHPDIGKIVMENVAKIVYDCLVHARQRLIAEFGLEAMYQAHRIY